MREQDLYRDMLKYRTGADEEGNSQFAVPLEADEDGLLGRECPSDGCTPRYFKVSLTAEDEGESMSDDAVTCPYCGTSESFQEFHTQAQIDWVTSMMVHDVEQGLVRQMKKSVAPLNRIRGGLINLRIDVKATPLPPVRKYVEEQLKQICTCESCSRRYAVYGISYHCPLCGEGALSSHLRESVATIRVLTRESDVIGDKHGVAAKERMLGNAAEDVVSIFEGFLKHVYRYAVQKKFPPEEAEQLRRRIRTNFQRLEGAEKCFRRDLSIELFDAISDHEREQLGWLFSKRHVLTHNLGLVDAKYREQVRAWEKEGQEASLDGMEIERALGLVERVVSAAIESAL